ncbi:uncharacterized protein LOC143291878 [Babylonia areolata]|uniref:uncharacterized protein LOC143291878 n=1 Tax=Babylonia areolata TaxID=304850 RepID=UPI003FD2835F
MKLLLLCAVLVTVSFQGGWAQCSLFGKVPAQMRCCSRNDGNCCAYGPIGPCFCNIYSADSTCFGFYPVTADNTTHCCGHLKHQEFESQESYEYIPSDFEKTRVCRRNPSMTWNTPQSTSPMPPLGPCSCKKEATSCFAPTTHATTATTATTTTKPPPICPAPSSDAFTRTLGGSLVVDSCTVDGLVNFRVGPTQVCNGVLGYNPTTQSNQLFITDFCLAFMKGVMQTQSIPAYGVYNAVAFPITQQTVSTPVGNQISAVALPTGILPKSRCKTAACLYNKNAMSSIIDFSSCYIASYGYDEKLSQTVVNTGTLKIVNVTKETTCTSHPVTSAAQCFIATDPNVHGCWGDNGAPVFCRLSLTNEAVLYGLVDVIGQPPKQLTGVFPKDICASSNEFHVMPVS